jgi:hypothetical protein
MSEWIPCSDSLPPEAVPVMTKIDDYAGVRNQQSLKRMGRLWFFPDGSMYVYYEPTHWRPLTDEETEKVIRLKIVWERLGGHTHMAVFSGLAGKQVGKAGDLCMTNEEFEAWKNATAQLEFVERTPPVAKA